MIQIIIDPKNMYFGHELEIVRQAEILISWVLNPAFKNASMLDTIKQQYLFGWFPIDVATIEDGIIKCPGDLDFYPLLYVQKGNFEDDEHFYFYRSVYFYRSDFIAIKTKGTYEIARID